MTDIDKVATDLVAAHQQRHRIDPPRARLKRSDILAVQTRVSAALGPVAGFKVARNAGGPPILAPIPACYRVANGGTRFVQEKLGVELEVGFELVRALPAPTLPARPQDYFRPCVVLELCDSRVMGDLTNRPDLKFADLQQNAGLVVGSGPARWDGSDFGPLTARLTSAANTVLDGPARIPGGSALANLNLLISHLGDHCGGLVVGQTIITGSLCGLPWFAPETLVCGSIDGLGTVSITLCQSPDQASGKVPRQARPDP